MSQYRYGVQKRHYRAGDREGIQYPIKRSEGMFGVIDYYKKKKLPKNCPFDSLSYDGYTMRLKTLEYDSMDDLPFSYDLCPNHFVSVNINDETSNVVELFFLAPEFLGLGEYSEWEDVKWVISKIGQTLLEQQFAWKKLIKLI